MKIKKVSDGNVTVGTSFHGTQISSTVNKLKKVLGEPIYEDNFGDDKVNIEWELALEDGTVFTVYDWKMYNPIGYEELIYFHVGGFSKQDTEKVKREILNKL